jgi:enolase-phosphatase E1
VSGTPRAILLDVEGTTTPVDFVYRALFPYARARLEAYLEAHAEEPEVAKDLTALRDEHARDLRAGRRPPAWRDSPAGAAEYARWLMDRDRKATSLKSLQGKIWAEGYRKGELRSQVYEDVPRALRRWTEAGAKVAIFSSGSVLAQKLLFAHAEQGDLTRYLTAYFDTTTGAKAEAESYRRIAAALGLAPGEILFVSDAASELEAAHEAGCDTTLAVRSPTLPTETSQRVVRSFDELP